MLVPALLAAFAVATPTQVDTTVRISRGTTVSIDGAMRGVRLRTADGDQVVILGAAEVDAGARRLSIDAGFLRGRSGTELVVTVPRWARVELEGVSGDITVEQAPAELDVESFNGRVSVTGGDGTMRISNATGSVHVRGFTGRVLDVESLSGGVTIDGATGTIHVETVNEQIVMRNVRAGSVSAESTNGSITWAGAIDPSARYHFGSHNGNVLLEVPASIDARLRISTFQGGFDTAIPGRTTGNGAGRRPDDGGAEREFTVTYGRGSADVRVETFNGSVRVRRLGET